ncbi:glutathione S-transferase A-like [Corythoichthys intestinalis]|uniref:glutathione S-transferase A-like n=1 Tax=Corythoichthys intestinalis TaxID=161448 RepID=UPI0025A57172|nr:glutathione S-transferase A-like [Corythoichthys intestinalis]XP_061808213.1 glutathione S-transferase A-like [Nerophis lumbriciformis]
MAQEIVLYWGEGSTPCWRVMIALEEKGLSNYTSKRLAFEKMEHKSAEVMALNPRGQLPTFKFEEKIINESCAACMFLECKFKDQGNQLTPTSCDEKAKMFQRLFEGLTLGQKLGEVIYYDWKVPEGERHESAKTRNREALRAELQLWEGYMAKETGPYIAGKTFSLADVIIFPSIAYAFYLGLCPKRFPKLAQYHDMVKERPSINKTWFSAWKDNNKDTLKDI